MRARSIWFGWVSFHDTHVSCEYVWYSFYSGPAAVNNCDLKHCSDAHLRTFVTQLLESQPPLLFKYWQEFIGCHLVSVTFETCFLLCLSTHIILNVLMNAKYIFISYLRLFELVSSLLLVNNFFGDDVARLSQFDFATEEFIIVSSSNNFVLVIDAL